MKCCKCYKNMRMELKIKNRCGEIQKWKCECGKETLKTIKGNVVKINVS